MFEDVANVVNHILEHCVTTSSITPARQGLERAQRARDNEDLAEAADREAALNSLQATGFRVQG